MNFYRRYFWAIIFILSSLVTTVDQALAETKETSIVIRSNDTTSSYRNLMLEAESSAQEAIAREFAQNPEITEITIAILGERLNQIVPLLRVQVSRNQWQKEPAIEKWARYFTAAEFLLGFRDSGDTQSNSSLSRRITRNPSRRTRTSPTTTQASPTTTQASPTASPPLPTASPPSSANNRRPSSTEQRERRIENDPAFRDD